MTDKEESVFFHRLFKKVKTAIDQYNLIEENDRILVGLSGGKDSLALLEFLSQRQRAKKPAFSLVAVHVTMENIPYQSDIQYLKDYSEKLGVKFVHVKTSFDPASDKRKSPCFLCSWNRRKMLFSTAKEFNCNKIALGHHLDDVLQTLLMNLTFQGSYSTMPPLLKMNKFDMTIIRPMTLIEESDLQKMAEIRQFQKQKKLCPFESDSNRSDIKAVLEKMIELNPHAKSSLWNAMTNVQEDYLPKNMKTNSSQDELLSE